MGHTITVRLTAEQSMWLEETAKTTGVPQGRIIREQIDRARTSGSTRRFMRLAGSVTGGPRDVSTRKGFSRS